MLQLPYFISFATFFHSNSFVKIFALKYFMYKLLAVGANPLECGNFNKFSLLTYN